MSEPLSGVVRLFDRLNAAAAWLARWSVLLMLAIGIWNVVGRYLGSAIGINLSSNGLIEAQWYLFDLIFLPASAGPCRKMATCVWMCCRAAGHHAAATVRN